jgi:hypothetical protein
MSAVVKELIQYFGAVDADEYARSVADDATQVAQAALRRRRPDLRTRAAKRLEVPEEEQTQFELDQLAFVTSVADRLLAEMNGIVFDARRHGASWARIGAAINESPQTAFNRYRKLEARAPSGVGKQRQAARRKPG